ncbi:uncharacterized protein LOC134205947 [Armigeres subalbatus]|uniref:uncharacterized protein LOC134205947 n=1 Tax=Armigeres subalbatus TaxID=124917 RepID=UPI002ED3F60A
MYSQNYYFHQQSESAVQLPPAQSSTGGTHYTYLFDICLIADECSSELDPNNHTISYSFTRRGKPIVTIDGYSFKRSSAKRAWRYWMCTKIDTEKGKYADVIRYTLDKKGVPRLAVGGFRFSRRIIRKDSTRWYCVKMKSLDCRARITTTSGKVIQFDNVHNHLPADIRKTDLQSTEVVSSHNAQQYELGKYADIIRYTLDKKGVPRLEVGGCLFSRKRIVKDQTRWYCVKMKSLACRARITTATSGKVLQFDNVHNHLPADKRKLNLQPAGVALTKNVLKYELDM